MRETRGFSPNSSRWSVCAMSGTGCSVLVPNTASLPANLFEQSWVPEEKERRTPTCAMNDPSAGPAKVLKAVGLPM